MPKIQTITDIRSIAKCGGNRIYFAPPIDYDRIMKTILYGEVSTMGDIREHFSLLNGADFTAPITAGIFVSIAAWASDQWSENETPYWRMLKANGELAMCWLWQPGSCHSGDLIHLSADEQKEAAL